MSFLHRKLAPRVPPDEMQRDILEVAEELGLDLQPSGKDWYACICPIHQDTDPSLRVSASGHWLCYGCSTGGSAAHLYKFITGCDLATAIRATLLEDVDQLDIALVDGKDESHTEQSIIALQLLLVQRFLDFDDDTDFPMDEWMRAIYESDTDDELLTRLRQIA